MNSSSSRSVSATEKQQQQERLADPIDPLCLLGPGQAFGDLLPRLRSCSHEQQQGGKPGWLSDEEGRAWAKEGAQPRPPLVSSASWSWSGSGWGD